MVPIQRHGATSLVKQLNPDVMALRWCEQVDKKGRVKDRTWKSVQKMMTDPGKFLLTLKADVDGMGQRLALANINKQRFIL